MNINPHIPYRLERGSSRGEAWADKGGGLAPAGTVTYRDEISEGSSMMRISGVAMVADEDKREVHSAGVEDIDPLANLKVDLARDEQSGRARIYVTNPSPQGDAVVSFDFGSLGPDVPIGRLSERADNVIWSNQPSSGLGNKPGPGAGLVIFEPDGSYCQYDNRDGRLEQYCRKSGPTWIG